MSQQDVSKENLTPSNSKRPSTKEEWESVTKLLSAKDRDIIIPLENKEDSDEPTRR